MIKVEEIVKKYKGYEVDEEKLEKLLTPPKQKTVYDLKVNDKYFWIEHDGTVHSNSWFDDELDNCRRNFCNCFLTEQEAQFEIERRRVESTLLKYGRRNFKKGKNNYFMQYLDGSNVIIGIRGSRGVAGNIYFDTLDLYDKAFKEVGFNNIKKYIFGVDLEREKQYER